MSAWVVSQGHIDLMVNGLIQHGFIEEQEGTAVGRELLAENVASVSFRYGTSKRSELPGFPIPRSYTYVPPSGPERWPDSAYRVAARCYDYQSCEHPDWENSYPSELAAKLAALPEDDKEWPWGFSDDDIHPEGRNVGE